MDPKDQAKVSQLLERSEKAFQELKASLPADLYPHTVAYLTGLVEDSLAYLRYLLETGKKLLLSTNRLKSIWSRVVLRIKKIGRRWSRLGALRMLAASLLYLLHPDRYQQLEAQNRGDCLLTTCLTGNYFPKAGVDPMTPPTSGQARCLAGRRDDRLPRDPQDRICPSCAQDRGGRGQGGHRQCRFFPGCF